MQRLVITCVTSAIDGTEREYRIETDNRDRVRWELYANRHDLPKGNEAPFLFSTFLAWSALKRTKALPDTVDFDTFLEATPDTEATLEDVDPTRSATAAD